MAASVFYSSSCIVPLRRQPYIPAFNAVESIIGVFDGWFCSTANMPPKHNPQPAAADVRSTTLWAASP